jgi:hypothetical protein
MLKYSQRCLRDLIRLAITAPLVTVLLARTLAGAALWYTVHTLEFETSRNAPASSHARYIQTEKALNTEWNWWCGNTVCLKNRVAHRGTPSAWPTRWTNYAARKPGLPPCPWLTGFADKLAFLQRNLDPRPITLADVPDHLRQRFVGKSGRYLLQIFPRHNIWERASMRAFVTQLQAIDADITGPPVIAFHAMRQMQRGYTRGGMYASFVIVGIILLLFRRLRPTLLVLLPVLFGGLWTMACMALVDLQLNMANLIILPLFLGIAVDDGIHLVHRILEDPQNAAAPLAHSTGKAIVLTSLTSMVGFGSLMVARHSGVFSLGLLTTIAVGCSLLATLLVLPVVIHLLSPGVWATSSE